MMDHIAYLKFVLETLRLTPNALAKKAGISPSTLTRYLSKVDNKFVISNATINKISDATGINPGPFLYGSPAPQVQTVLNMALSDLAKKGKAPFGAYCEIKVNPGVWIDKDLHSGLAFPVFLGLPPLQAGSPDGFYAAIEGDSLNLIAPDESVLFCRRLGSDILPPNVADGAVVIIKQWSSDKRLFELSGRKVVRDGERVSLTFASADSMFDVAPLVADGGRIANVEFLGLALSNIRQLSH